MPKCRKTWARALKAGNTTGNAHPAKADAATAVANSPRHATTEPATVEATTGKSSTSATVESTSAKPSASTPMTSCHSFTNGCTHKEAC
jgi:hypothetical protein